MRGARLALVAVGVLGVSALWAATAFAGAFPGTNGLIAFTGGSGADREIFTISPDGQGLVQLTDNSAADFDPSWSGDGERIAFQSFRDGDSEIFAMDFHGENQTQLTFNSAVDQSPTFSPDGERIAFVGEDGTDNEIFVMNADGSNPAPVTNNTEQDFSPSFSPDGNRIVLAREVGASEEGEIFVINSDGSNETPLTDNLGSDLDPAWSPDQLGVVFSGGPPVHVEGPTGIVVMDADGQNPTPLTTGFLDLGAAFAPNGQRIAFSRATGEGANGDIFLMDSDGQNQAPLTTDPGDEADPDWQPLNPPACQLTGPAKQKSFGSVVTTVTCSEDATVLASGQGKAPKALKLAAASKAKKFTLEPTTIEVPPDQPTVLILAVPKKGKKALKNAAKAGKKGKATVTATATDDLGESAQDSLAVKFKKRKK